MAGKQEQKIGDFKIAKTGGVQMHGILSKKPIGHKSTVWQKRFFVLKESFLLYYPEAERKVFADKGVFNIHPKGIVPLGYCNVEETPFPGINYGIKISLPDDSSAICLGAEDYDTRCRWVEALELASKVTLENCSLGEAMIKSLQEQQLQMAKENKEIYEKFRKEAKEADSEREQREILEEFNQQLIEEKLRIEFLVEELQRTQQTIRKELDDAIETYQNLEQERTEMLQTNDALHSTLMEVAAEREAISERLSCSEAKGEESAHLRHQLEELSKQTEQLREEKNSIDEKLQTNELKMQEYSKEKEQFCSNVNELKNEIQELNEEKDNVEVKLKEEILERRNLQQQLNECKEALQRLEEELISSRSREVTSGKANGISNQLAYDMKNLRQFFETFTVTSSMENGLSDFSKRRCSRRYTQIKKLRHIRTNNLTVPAPQLAHEKLSSTPGIIAKIEDTD